MASLDKDLITENIFRLLDYSGVSDISFANLLEVSDKQIKRIKKGEASFSIDNINKACIFFNKALTNMNSTIVEYEHDYRLKLIKKHKANQEYSKLLIDRPSISYAIKHVLLVNDTIKKGMTVKQIREIFKAHGWIFTSAYVSLALKRNSDLFNIIPNPQKTGTFIYIKK